MRTIYNILFDFFFALSTPYYFFRMWRRGHWRTGFAQRFAKYDARLKQRLTNRHVLWMHAVSVGEVNLCTQLIRVIEPQAPNLKIVVSTTTSTGMGELNKLLPSHIEKIYYPIDRRRHVQRSQALINPEAFVLVEAELWPNFIWGLQRRKIPHLLVNARLSNRSYRRYKWFGFLFRPLFASFSGVGAQSEADAVRLRELGFRPEAIQVFGSLKFDAARLDERRFLDVPEMFSQLGVASDSLIWVAGSTHAGEEAILSRVLVKLRPQFPKLFLVVVPRHMERGAEAGKEVNTAGVRSVFRSEITPQTRRSPNSTDVLIVNTTGELRFFYQHADIVFVGKSLTAQGGQNPIEPAALGKPVVFGPHMQNFSEIVPQFLSEGGAIQVADEAQLERAMIELLSNPQRRKQMGEKGRIVVEKNRGGLERTAEMILKHVVWNESAG